MEALSIAPSNRPYQEVFKLYVMHACYAFVSRMWEMSIVLLTAQLTNNSLTLVAMSGFTSSLSIFLFMPTIGGFLDRTGRMSVVVMALLSKLTFLTTTYILCAILLAEKGSYYSISASFVYVIPLLYACASLSFNAITQSIEKDWLVVLSAGDSSWLTSTNSVMSQIDLAASALGPFLTGVIMTALSPSASSLFFLCSNAVVTGFLFIFLRNLYLSWPALAFRAEKPKVQTITASSKTQSNQYRPVYTSEDNAAVDEEQARTGEEIASIAEQQSLVLRVIEWFNMTDFYNCGCAGVMVSYAFLYMTVLSFGSLMMVYLRWSGLSDHWIGLARGIASLFGFFGAFIFPSVKKWLGIRMSGLAAIWFQCTLVMCAALSFDFLNRYHAMVAIVALTLASRTGLWLFDLVVRQIAQETIPEHVRGKVNGQWKSMISFFDMSMYIIAIIVCDPHKFWLLTSLSALMVLLAALTYTFTTNSDSFGFIDYSTEYKKLRESVVKDGRVITQHYKLGKKLGGGSYATVYEGSKLSDPKCLVAIKVICKKSINAENEETILAEIDTMKKMNHPHIVKYYDHFEDESNFYLVLEKMEGGELFDRIGKKLKYNENEARDLVWILLGAVKYLHDKGIVHRDIKPENLLLVNDDDDALVKLGDFGFAKYATGLTLTTRIGSPFYMAPEIVSNRNYGTPVDMWALGVVTYVLVRGRMPFPCDDQSTTLLFEKIKKGEYSMNDSKWDRISIECKDLIRHLLNVNELERYTVDQAMAHPWLSKSSMQLEQVNLDEQLAEFKEFNKNRKFKAAVQTIIAMKRFQALGSNKDTQGR